MSKRGCFEEEVREKDVMEVVVVLLVVVDSCLERHGRRSKMADCGQDLEDLCFVLRMCYGPSLPRSFRH